MAKRKHKKTAKSLKEVNFLPFYYKRKWHLSIIVGLSILLYVNTLGHDYAQDDAIVIYDNMFTQEGFSGIPGLLTEDTFYGFFKEEGKAKLVSGGRYRPLTPIMFAIEYAIFGRNPFAGHLFNIIWYALLGWVLYLCLEKLFKQDNRKFIPLMIFSTCILFVAHPIHTEVVANIKGRDEILSLLGSLFALYALLRHEETRLFKWRIYAMAAFFLALMSKENAITFLAVVPLAFILFRKFSLARAIRKSWPLFAAAFVFLLIRSIVLGFDFGSSPNELMNNPFLKWEDNRWVPLAFGEKSATIIYTLGKYLLLLIFPHPLSHDYYPRAIDIMTYADWRVLLSLLAYLGLAAIAVFQFTKKKYLSFGILFYLLTLSIVSNIVFPIGTNMSERFLFMPSLGFALVLAYLIFRYAPVNNYALLAIALIVTAYSIKTVTRNTVWKDDYTLFTSDVSENTRSAKLLNAAAGAISNKVATMEESPERTELLNKAIGYVEKAIEIHPTYRNAYLILGNSCYYARRYDEAIANYEKCLQVSPGYAEVMKNMPIVLREAAKHAGQNERDYDKAEKLLLRAIEMQPNDFETNRLLGITYGIKGQHEKAIEYFNRALKIRPDSPAVYTSLGTAWLHLGDRSKADSYFARARELDPNAAN